MDPESTGHRISPQQISTLLKSHGRGLEVYAAQWSLNPEDCVQESFVKLAALSPPPENCVAWLFRVTRNNAISSLRTRKRRSEHESFASWLSNRRSTSSDPAQLVPVKEEHQRLVESLNKLEADEREMVVMRIWSGLTWSQIAELSGTSSSTAQRNYAAAIEKIRIQMESPCLTKPN
jgi:RNA polymerase sigma-70 factor (ECF subfamily)